VHIFSLLSISPKWSLFIAAFFTGMAAMRKVIAVEKFELNFIFLT
jgi:hypothetical protein